MDNVFHFNNFSVSEISAAFFLFEKEGNHFLSKAFLVFSALLT